MFSGKVKRLLVMMPPRHGKSSLISHYFPAWYLGNCPKRQVLLASYEADFAASWGRKARGVLEEYGSELFGVRLRGDSSAANRWEIDGTGGIMTTAGVGGPITGRGADCLIVDDPIKNVQEANSLTYRNNTWNWYTSVAYPRLEPNGAIILVQTRWHTDDLAGRILKDMETGGEHWDVLRFPAIAEVDEPMRKEGAALWPTRYPLSTLQQIRETIGPYFWAALYQQRPAPLEGGLFKLEWWRYSEPPEHPHTVQVWDTAFKVSTQNDFSVCATWAKTERGYYLLDLWRGKVQFPELQRMAHVLFEKWHPSRVLVEDAASGQSLIQTLSRDSMHLPILPVRVDTDKVSRASAVSGLVQAGKVFLPEHAPWLYDFLDEHANFPQGQHDDQVDTTSMALAYLTHSSGRLGVYV